MHLRNAVVRQHEELPRRVAILTPAPSATDSLITPLRAVPPRLVALAVVVATQIVLLLIALVPQTFWSSHNLPGGPIPSALTPVVAGLFYILPSLAGLLARRWQSAVIFATLPAWLDLGIFAVAAASRIGPYYLAVEPHAVSTVGTLELFAVLGALGWLARPLIFRAISWIRRSVLS